MLNLRLALCVALIAGSTAACLSRGQLFCEASGFPVEQTTEDGSKKTMTQDTFWSIGSAEPGPDGSTLVTGQNHWLTYDDNNRTVPPNNGAVEQWSGFVTSQGGVVINESGEWWSTDYLTNSLPAFGSYIGTLTCNDDGSAALSLSSKQYKLGGGDLVIPNLELVACEEPPPFDVVSVLQSTNTVDVPPRGPVAGMNDCLTAGLLLCDPDVRSDGKEWQNMFWRIDSAEPGPYGSVLVTGTNNWVHYTDESRTTVTNGAVEQWSGFVTSQGSVVFNEDWWSTYYLSNSIPAFGSFIGTLTCTDDGSASLSFKDVEQSKFGGGNKTLLPKIELVPCQPPEPPFDVVSMLTAMAT